tara:strand:- start:3906 stop:5162 length:1257 start_codon:yes stop_codon:yes gene_type:complete
MILEKTKHLCENCNKEHDAEIIKKGKEVYFDYTCKGKKKSVKISSDCKVFMHLRNFYPKTKFEEYKEKPFTMIELTNKCNYNCPICFASANEVSSKDFTIKELDTHLDKLNTRFIFLSGGEPTTLPDLRKIIKHLKKRKLKPMLLSNGHNLGKDNSLARSLKKAGLFSVGIQFDTFNPKTHLKIRGNKDIKTKIRAIDNCIKEGLSTGLVSMILNQNLGDIQKILNYAKSKQPLINLIQFQPAKIVGRFNYVKDPVVYREDIINEIIKSSIFPEVNLESFLPYPKFNPLYISAHPDCGAFLMLFKYKGEYIPLNKITNIKKLYDLLQSNSMKSNLFTKNIVPLYYLFKSTSVKNYQKIISSISGTLFKSKKNRILFITVSNYANKNYRDINRIKNCTNQIITKERKLKHPCLGWENDK